MADGTTAEPGAAGGGRERPGVPRTKVDRLLRGRRGGGRDGSREPSSRLGIPTARPATGAVPNPPTRVLPDAPTRVTPPDPGATAVPAPPAAPPSAPPAGAAPAAAASSAAPSRPRCSTATNRSGWPARAPRARSGTCAAPTAAATPR
ncbi:hypothetical protein ACFQ0M_44270 [Kitasatospora aburaviensis]